MSVIENYNAIFPKGDKASADYFTGTAWVNILVPQDETGSYAIGNVVFEPGVETTGINIRRDRSSLLLMAKAAIRKKVNRQGCLPKAMW
jgi:hypothetical protein